MGKAEGSGIDRMERAGSCVSNMCSCIGIEAVFGFTIDEEAMVVRRTRDSACGAQRSAIRLALLLCSNYA
jgi:hypothetical protein